MDKSVVEGTAIDKVKHALRSSGIVSPKIEEGVAYSQIEE